MSIVWVLIVFSGLLAICSGRHNKPSVTPVCIDRLNGASLNITCSAGMVILNPVVNVGWLEDGKCAPRRKDCRGETPDVIAETSNCYWKEGCLVKLNPYMPMTNATKRKCLAKLPTWATLVKHECINRSKLNFVCREESSACNIYYKDGVHALVSHKDYPWQYPKGPTTCRTTIIPPKGLKKLIVRLEAIDLDPENVDILTFNRISPKGKDSTRLGNSDQGYRSDIPKGSHLEIVFSIAGSSKSGKGFLIKFGSRRCMKRGKWKQNCARRKRRKTNNRQG